mmetsp:Transcript_64126/g.185884  ORF Transcript_64126/g.185884 Transcript_64126/m.185884 type:complete len:208 (+) Transcript_64126:207-830(+)
MPSCGRCWRQLGSCRRPAMGSGRSAGGHPRRRSLARRCASGDATRSKAPRRRSRLHKAGRPRCRGSTGSSTRPSCASSGRRAGACGSRAGSLTARRSSGRPRTWRRPPCATRCCYRGVARTRFALMPTVWRSCERRASTLRPGCAPSSNRGEAASLAPRAGTLTTLTSSGSSRQKRRRSRAWSSRSPAPCTAFDASQSRHPARARIP